MPFVHRLSRFTLVCLLLILTAGGEVYGQSRFMSLAPLSEVGQIRYADDLETTLVLVGIKMSTPIADLLPQVTPNSYLTFVRLLAGIRFEGTGVEIRGRATAVEFEIQKMPWAAAFSLLDFDASGFRNFSSDWISLGIGPGMDVGNREIRLSGRLIGLGSFNSTQIGSTVIEGELLDESETRHSLSYGLRGQASLSVQEILELSIKYELTKYSIDSDIEYSNQAATLGIRLISGIQLHGSFERVRYLLGDVDEHLNVLGFGLTLTPSAL
ncbi:MAG: hypothetical protein BMS9Abin05_1934 [Rhodothermia bacterium]|nr:MAG: hypothetical protein BMS9Abin05_1934 [Rhodothermia bacterium]